MDGPGTSRAASLPVSSAVPTTTDFAPPVRECPACGAECKRHSVYTRRVRDISLGGPVVLEVRVGNYRCKACNRFFKPDLPFAGKGKRYTDRAVRKATVAVQEDKATYTGLPHRLDRDFAVRPSKSTGWKWFQDFAGSIDITEYLRWACGRFSGQISVDSVFDRDAHIWFATDPLNKDLILGYSRCESPNGESLAAFLTTLRDDYGIRPALFTCDGAAAFETVPNQVWPEARVQLCHFHVIRALFRTYLRHSLAERPRWYKPTKPACPRPHPRKHRPPPWEVAAWERYERGRDEWVETHRKRRLFFKRLDSPTPDDDELKAAEFVANAARSYPSLAAFREFVSDVYALMGCKDMADAEAARQAFLAKWDGATPGDKYLEGAVGRFRDDRWFGKLFPFTVYANGHRTTNSTERANRWFRKRQKAHYRNRKAHTIANMLHADLVYRRERTPLGGPELLRAKAVPPAMAA